MVCLHVPLALSSAFSFLRCHSPTLLALVPIFFPSFFSLHHILIPPAAFLLLSSAVLAKKAFPSSNFVRAILTLPSYSVSCPLFPRICDRLLVKQPVSSPPRSFRGAPGKWAAVDTTTKTNMHSHTVTLLALPLSLLHRDSEMKEKHFSVCGNEIVLESKTTGSVETCERSERCA